MAAGRYVIRGGVAGRERLRLLSEVMGPSTLALLAEVGVPPGAVCLDLGCGGGDVTRELARLAGPKGRAVGVDLDEVKVDIARSESEERNVANVSFETRDVTRWAPEETFDVVYARFLLTHLVEPASLLAAVRPRVRKGGLAIVEDIDFRGHFAEPPCPALDRYVGLYSRCVRARGADPDIGPRLPGLLREAGFEDVRLRLTQPAALEGGVKLLTCVTLESIADAVVEEGLASEDELRATIEDLYAFARDPRTVIGGPRVFQAWGRA
jgi:SAM-dependent methyltransferase